jgi:putative ABC transport system substrate-binding protein
MRRREFITLLGGAAAASPMLRPLAARAQQGARMRRIGVLYGLAEDDPDRAPFVTTFQQRLQELGWTIGRNIRIDNRFDASAARYRDNAAELVGLAPDVLVATNTQSLQALQQRTHTIPIVFYRVSDPVENGLVASLARPGGNVTGFANNEFSMSGKWVELLKDIAPKVSRVLVILDPENPTWRGYFRTIETVAPVLGVQVVPAPVINAAGIERAIADFAREPNGSIVVLPGSVTTHQALIATLAVRHRLPAVYPTARSSGLMSYGPNLLEQVRGAAGYVDRILKGEKPADLPVQQPTKFELVLNLKAAKAIGLDVPAIVLVRATEVID